METVNKNFIIYRYVETALILASIVLIILYRTNTDKQFWFGLGLALAIQTALMLGADYFAEKRAKLYTTQLKSLTKQNDRN